MRIALWVDAARRRRWHGRLAERLTADGHHVVIATAPSAGPPSPTGLALLLDFERIVYGGGLDGLFDAEASGESGGALDAADLSIDLGSGSPNATATRRWRLLFDGVAGESGLLHALLDRDAPAITLTDAETGAVVASGLPALENPRRLGAGLDAVLARVVGLCRHAVRDLDRHGATASRVTLEPPSRRSGAALPFGLASLSAKIADRLTKLAGRDHRWQTGWRSLAPGATDGVQARFAWPSSDYRWLPDDGRRFYADPFVFTANGRTVMFVEEYPYATRRGLIAAVDLAADGTAGPPRPVLERPYHLSYPSVFARDGATWMIPETSGNRTIELYRADPFPDRWVLEAVLVDNVSAGDATLLEHEGQLYLFAATNDDGGSTWDQLSIFCAPTLRGPWRPHARNPVLIDAGSARPAGFTFGRDGALIRPAQDCRDGYGAGLTFCRIDHLDPERFAQTVVSRLPPAPRWRASGAHTLNVGGGFEAIDRIGPRRR